MGAQNRRVAQRAPLAVTITRSDSIDPGVYGAVDISETGIRLNSSRPERLESFVALEFELEAEKVRVYAKTVWCRDDLEAPAGLPYSVGLLFLAPDRSLVERIRRYVDQRVRAERA